MKQSTHVKKNNKYKIEAKTRNKLVVKKGHLILLLRMFDTFWHHIINYNIEIVKQTNTTLSKFYIKIFNKNQKKKTNKYYLQNGLLFFILTIHVTLPLVFISFET